MDINLKAFMKYMIQDTQMNQNMMIDYTRLM